MDGEDCFIAGGILTGEIGPLERQLTGFIYIRIHNNPILQIENPMLSPLQEKTKTNPILQSKMEMLAQSTPAEIDHEQTTTDRPLEEFLFSDIDSDETNDEDESIEGSLSDDDDDDESILGHFTLEKPDLEDSDVMRVTLDMLITDDLRKKIGKPNPTEDDVFEYYEKECKRVREEFRKSNPKPAFPSSTHSLEDSMCYLAAKGRPDFENRCIVTGLPLTIQVEALEEAFSPYGEIVESKIIMDPKISPFGFVSFASEQSMIDAVTALNGRNLRGCDITVEKTKLRRPVRSKDGGQHS